MGMNPEVKRSWLKALRSGEYQQTIGVLRGEIDSDTGQVGYCCLGVLCELAVKAEVIPAPVSVSNAGRRAGEYDGERITLPVSVQRWAGLDHADPSVSDPKPSSHIRTVGVSWLNDVRGMDFAGIADVIEREL